MMSIQKRTGLFIGTQLFVAAIAFAQPAADGPVPANVTKSADIAYATVDDHELALDLYMPKNAANPPLLVWVHGGAWTFGTKDNIGFAMSFVEAGYALASVEFRSAEVARFPAQVHDIKGAIRYLRGNADRLGYDAERIAIMGVSSGGHLAQLVGVTNGHTVLEGELGDHRDQSSSVQAIVSYFGASNFASILSQSTPRGLDVRVPALERLLGGQPEDKSELAKLASPVTHVDAGDPPLLLLHGDQDPQMPINQTHEIHSAYKDLSLPVAFEVVHGAGHGGDQFGDARRIELVRSFLDKQLRM